MGFEIKTDFELKTHRLEVDTIEDDQGIIATYKHYMTVLFDGREKDILITRNEVTGELEHYYVRGDGSVVTPHQIYSEDLIYRVSEWMEEVAGQPLDVEDGEDFTWSVLLKA